MDNGYREIKKGEGACCQKGDQFLIKGANVWCYASHFWQEGRSYDTSFNFGVCTLRRPIALDNETSADYRPEVGGKCEVLTKERPNEWLVVTIRFIGEKLFIYSDENSSQAETVSLLYRCKFRPLQPTPLELEMKDLDVLNVSNDLGLLHSEVECVAKYILNRLDKEAK